MSENKICYLVLGSEGAGTYMLAEALVSSGCTYVAENDNAALFLDKSPAVIRRSLPHAGEWPDIIGLVEGIGSCGWMVKLLYIYRTPKFIVQSVLRRDNTRDQEEVMENIKRVDSYVLSNIDVHAPVSYGLFVTDKKYRKLLFKTLGLRPPTIEFYNANDKYKEGDDE